MIRSTGRGTSTDPNWVTRKDYTRFSFIYPRSEAPSNSSLQTRCIVFFNFGPSIPALCWKHAATHEQKSYQEVILEVKNHDMGCKDKGSLSKSPIGQEETWHIHKLLTNVRTTPTLVLCYELSPLRFLIQQYTSRSDFEAKLSKRHVVAPLFFYWPDLDRSNLPVHQRRLKTENLQ